MTFRPTFNAPQNYPLVYFICRTRHEDGQHSIVLSVRGQRYEYILTPPQCDTTEYLCRKVSARKALNYAKSKASEVRKI